MTRIGTTRNGGIPRAATPPGAIPTTATPRATNPPAARSRVRRRLLPALAVVAVTATVLSGCVGAFLPSAPDRTSTPTGESVSAELKPFYGQELTWKNCADGMQCATAIAPLDWSDPTEGRIDLALIRHPASGDRKGSLLVNPGGPGGSGYDFVRDSLDYAVDATLRANFDVVGFDPRGVQHSTPVRCYEEPQELTDYIYGITPGTPGSPEWISATEAATKAFGDRCAELTGPLLGQVDTRSAARDLDMLRAALGDAKLNYLGYSYGTFLGATYAGLFPKKTGRLVLDGALDPATSDFDVSLVQAEGFESAFAAYLKDCIGSNGCPFRGSVADARTQTRELLDRLQATPLRSSDGRLLGDDAMFTAIIYPLYSQESWPELNTLFAEVFRGRTTQAFRLADDYNGLRPDGTYADNTTEAFIAINCLDYTGDADLTTMRSQAAELEQKAPVFGAQFAYGGIGCVGWPYPSEAKRGAIHAAGSAPILVVGTTNDPATPYVWAKALAKELDNGHLVTYHGEGHTGYNKGSDCVNSAVDRYLVDGTVPAKDPDCR